VNPDPHPADVASGLARLTSALDPARLPSAGDLDGVAAVLVVLALLVAAAAGWRRGLPRVALGLLGGAAGALAGVPLARWLLGADALAGWSPAARGASGLAVLLVAVGVLAGAAAGLWPRGRRPRPRAASRLGGGALAVLAAAAVLAVALPLAGPSALRPPGSGVQARVQALTSSPTVPGALLARVVGAPAAVLALGPVG